MIMGKKPFEKKTTTFLYPNSSSMQYPTLPQATTTVLVPNTKQDPCIELYPTSPQLFLGHEMLHFSHPQHPLSDINLPDSFTCAGCKEFGAGMRFTCQQCNFELHHFCALALPALKAHPFHLQHQLVLYSKPGKNGALSKCDICSKPAKGFTYRCSVCSFQMHPCCAMLSTEINIPTHPHTLRLLPARKLSSNDTNSFICGECKRKRSGRVFHCTVCDYHLHAACAKNMINGLHANGINGIEKPNMIGAAARLASQVVIEFIGGLVEGLGQSLGEVLVQNSVRGKCISNGRNRRIE